jgi:hypothetical protein
MVDAYHVPKLLSQQLLPFGRSGDELGELTFGVEQFLPLSVRRGQCARRWRTIREEVADGPQEQCSSGVVRALAHLCFRSALISSFGWKRFRTVRCSGTDSPWVPGGRSACSPQTVRFSRFATGGSVCFKDSPRLRAGQSAVRVRTVRGCRSDSPHGPCGQSAPPGRTVRQSLAALFLGSIPSSFFRASACASRNRS